MVLLICFFASFLQGTTGFGFGLVSMAFLPLLLPFKSSIVISSIVSAIIAAQVAYKYRKYIKLKIVIIPTIVSLITSSIGVALVLTMNLSIIKSLLGWVLISLSIYFFVTRKKNIYIKTNVLNGIIIGSITGIVTGMFNIGGPFLALYFFYGTKEPLEYKGTLSLNFAITSTWTSLIHLYFGGFQNEYLSLVVIGIIGGVIATVLSHHLFKNINRDLLGILTYILVAVMGVLLI